MIKTKNKGVLLSAESKPYDVDGNKGVSHKARFLVDNQEIYNLVTNEEEVVALKQDIEAGKTVGDLEIGFTSKKENLKGELLSFKPVK